MSWFGDVFGGIGDALGTVGSAVTGFLGGGDATSSILGPLINTATGGLGGSLLGGGLGSVVGSLFGGGGGGGSSQPTSVASTGGGGGGMGDILSILGLVNTLTGGSMMGQEAPEAPVYELDPQAKALLDSLTNKFQKDLSAPGGMTDLDNQQLERMRALTFGQNLGSDAQKLYEQQAMHGISGSHPAFQSSEALRRSADNMYWDTELAMRKAARDRQLQLQNMAMGVTGMDTNNAAAKYDSAYDAWKTQNQNWQKEQDTWAQLAGPALDRWGLV